MQPLDGAVSLALLRFRLTAQTMRRTTAFTCRRTDIWLRHVTSGFQLRFSGWAVIVVGRLLPLQHNHQAHYTQHDCLQPRVFGKEDRNVSHERDETGNWEGKVS